MAVTIGALSFADTDWLGLAALLAIGFVIAWASGLLYARYALTHPPRRTYATALARTQPGTPGEMDGRFGSGPRPFTTWALRRGSGPGDLPVWEIPGDDSSGPTIILTHGWGDGRIGGLLRLEPFLARASRVLLWDLPGHGDAPAECGPCRLGRIESADLLALIDKTQGPVVLFGWSLGGGLSLIAGSHPRVIAVAVEAPYVLPQTPASRVMAAKGLPGMGMLRAALFSIGGAAWQCSGGPFDRAAHAAKLTVPLLVIHGEADPVCPVDDGRAIAAAALHSELLVIPDARHNDLWINPSYRSACCSALAAWLHALSLPAAPASGPTHPHRSQTP